MWGKTLLDWCELLGGPGKGQIDQDSCCRGIFKATLDTFGIEDILVARDAHWSHGLVEIRTLMLKEIIAKWRRSLKQKALCSCVW